MDTNQTLTFKPVTPKKTQKKLVIRIIFLTFFIIEIINNIMNVGQKGETFGIIFLIVLLIIGIELFLKNSYYIRLSTEGIEIREFYQRRFIKWYDVEQFGHTSIANREMITIKYSANHMGNKTIKNIRKILIGAEGAFDTQGHPGEEMVKVLNEWKGKYAKIG